MNVKTISFEPCEPTPWHGRYARIPGETSVFHLVVRDGRWWPVIYWNTDEGEATCAAADCSASRVLAEAVSEAKWAASQTKGGSFLINEFGQVIVPSSRGDGTRMLAGTLTGNLLFENPFDPDEPIDLSDDSQLQPGDPWQMPYVGMMYRFSKQRKIYFWDQRGDESIRIDPNHQDPRLNTLLYEVRRGAGRFIVNPFGIVLTKQRDDWNDNFLPTFVGRIDKRRWFEKEGG